jgi:hypothetical protein
MTVFQPGADVPDWEVHAAQLDVILTEAPLYWLPVATN